MPTDNTHRSLRRLVVVDAWFRRSANRDDRYTLHADVSFNEERLGGDTEAMVIFKVAVKQCEVVFIPPKFDFKVDRNSVRRQRPLKPQEIASSRQRKRGASGRLKLSLNRKPAAGADIGLERSRSSEQTSKSTQTKSMYNEQFTRSVDGHDAWRVDGQELANGRLLGPVFDVDTEPRLTLIDLRSEARRASDEMRSMTPLSRIEVRCMRDDIDIYEVRMKDEDKQGWLANRPGHKERLHIAREVLREALLQEELSVGSLLNDPYAEMTICDATLPILDQSAESRREGSNG